MQVFRDPRGYPCTTISNVGWEVIGFCLEKTMIPYPHPLTAMLEPAESHPLHSWNHPTLIALWTLAETPLQALIDSSAPQLDALKLEIPTSLKQAEDTQLLIRQGLEASLLKTDRDGVHIDNLLDSVDIDDIKTTLKAFLAVASPPAAGGLLDHIDGDWLTTTPAEIVRAYPMTALVKVLTTPRAAELANGLRLALGWYSNDGSQVASGLMDFKLLVAAVRIQLDPHGDLDGFELQSATLVGQRYDYIRRQFEDHLLRRQRVASPQSAIIAYMALLEHLPSDFAILGIPPDLPYRSSTRWVQFRHGVELAEAIQPGAARTMSYQQLADYPLQIGLDATTEQQQVIGMALVPAVLSWARADIALAPTLPEIPDGEDLQRILKAYLDENDALQTALENISAPLPQRFDIARRLLQAQGISADQLYVNRPMPPRRKRCRHQRLPHQPRRTRLGGDRYVQLEPCRQAPCRRPEHVAFDRHSAHTSPPVAAATTAATTTTAPPR